jgi:carbon storage regulator CsrA
MLILTRRPRQVVVIGQEIHVIVLDVAGDRVRLGITAPREIRVLRQEAPDRSASPSRPAHFERLLNFLRRKGRSHEDAEDLIQEAMLRLHRYRRAEVPVINEEAFLTHAVQNLSIDLHRRREVRREFSFEHINPTLIEPFTPEISMEAAQRLNRIAGLLEASSTRTREIYFAHRAGYSYDEIAAHFKISHITIRRHIARALLVVMEHAALE